MTTKHYTECDICGSEITHPLFARFRRRTLTGIVARVYKWCIVDYHPVESDWVADRVDLCGECWNEVKIEIRERTNDD